MRFITRILSLFMLLFVFSSTGYTQTLASKNAFVQWVTENGQQPMTVHTAVSIVEAAFVNAKKHSIDPLLILSIIKAESGFRPGIRNSYGASGLMQVVPKYHQSKIAGRNILNVGTNIEVGTKILHECLVGSNDNLYKAMRCYSGGAAGKYLREIEKTHRSLRSADVELRFRKELPLTKYNAWGAARTEQPPTVIAFSDDGYKRNHE